MDELKLDGREFTGITQSLTANQDDYLLGHLRSAGAIEVLGDLDKKRSREKKHQDLLTKIMLSGSKYHIIAGFLTEVGKKWSREEADRNAAAFSEITDLEQKQIMQTAIVRFVIGFFQSGEQSLTSSPKSSNHQEKDLGTSNGERAISGSLPS